jgi:hypothetical protein
MCKTLGITLETGATHYVISEIQPFTIMYFGARGGTVVEALCYKPESRGIDSGWCHWNFSLT